ncbi:NADH:flavin oxidoreductase [Pseudomonas umsongensis]|uniref:NADH:flavin oxidoreductase n=1 Tax=Pseudomonas umsongensis TaxID=198618 RepID=UPI001CDB75C5|nr:NADH:flavin oxidoreductase [Pseudomonas umsongensis]
MVFLCLWRLTASGLNLKNRTVMSPMTRYFSPGGVPTPEVAEYYERRAKGGVGLIIGEGAFIDRSSARSVDTAPSFYGEALGEWGNIVNRVHAVGGAMAPQLWHVGGMPDFNFPNDELNARLESPSGLRGPDVGGGTPMTEEDIADAVASFARAAAQAKLLGFDSVEFHGAHGYLFDQFFWSATNQRKDGYGGTTLGERTRFACEVLRAVRKEVGEDFALIFRMSQWKTYFYDARLAETPALLEEWVTPLVDAGVDIFDCSQRRFWEPEFADSSLNLAGWVKKITSRPTITVGSVGLSTDLYTDFHSNKVSDPTTSTIIEVAERLDKGEFDLVAVGRALLADANWVDKVAGRRFDDLVGYSVDMMKTLV